MERPKGSIVVGSDHRGRLELAYAQGYGHPVHGFRVPTPEPVAGGRVLYRSNDWCTPVLAEVVETNIDPEHPNMSFPHPWPTHLILVQPEWPASKLDAASHKLPGAAGPRAYMVRCHEARPIGAAGWLPLDWQMRFYAPQGD